MKILLFGGFLGSGKTSIIRAFIDAIRAGQPGNARGPGTIAIIENEIGETGIDDTLLRKGSAMIKPLFGGCVCCEISGSLLGAIDDIHRQISPEWLIIELTGVAEVSSVKDLLNSYIVIEKKITAVSVVDGSRWHRLQKIGPFIRNQIMDCDVAILNKIDLCSHPDGTAKNVMEITGVKNIVYMSKDMDRAAISARILETCFNLSEAGAGQQDAVHDHEEHSHDHGGAEMAGVYSRSFTVRGSVADGSETDRKEALVKQAASFFEELGGLLSRDEILYGHTKGLLSGGEDSFVRFSLTQSGSPDILVSDNWNASAGSASYVLTLNIISMEHTAEEIAAIAEPCVMRYPGLFGPFLR